MSRSTEQIVALWQDRKARLEPTHRAALEVRHAYYGDIVLPLPEMDRTEKPLVANLLLQGGEQKAMRLSSTMPNVYFPSLKPGQDLADKRARERRAVTRAWWDIDRMRLKLRKRARHMVFYASSPVMLRPNFDETRPTWQVRNPLTCLPPEMDVGELVPEDVIFTYVKSYAWLAGNYPSVAYMFGDDIEDAIFTIIEYQDGDEYVLIVSGEKPERSGGMMLAGPRQTIQRELERVPNLCGRCTCVIPGRIGLEHPRGELDGVVGLWQAHAKLMALLTIGTQREIWPEEWLVDDPNGEGASIVTHADPLRGVTGHVTGGKLEVVSPQMSQMAPILMDRIERGVRLEGGIPAELGGESTSNIRTGRRGDAVLSAVLDFPIQEAQEIIALSLQEENKIAIAIDRDYFPTTKSFYLSTTGGEIVYEPTKLWERDINWVSYSHAGVDAQGQIVELGQMIGIGMMSRQSAMEAHPMVEDAQAEFDRITNERIRDALLNGLTTMAVDPTFAPVVAAVAVKVRETGMDIEDAVRAVHEELQKMQAEAAQQAQQPAGGLPAEGAQPGMGEPVPAIAPPTADVTNLTSLLTQLGATEQIAQAS